MFQRIRLLAVVAGAAMVLSACGGAEERAANYLDRAQAAFDQGDYVKAELDAKNTLQIEPNSFEASYLMSQIAEKQERPGDMFRFLQRSAAIDSSNVDVQVKLGRIWAAAGRLDEARAAYAAIEASAPGNPDGAVLNAIIEMREGDREAALARVESVLQEHPRNVGALTFMASYYRQADVDKSLEMLDRAIGFQPEDRSLREIKIAVLQSVQRFDDAEKELRDLIARFPDQNNYRYSLARYLTSRDRLDDAQSVYREVVDGDPEDLTAKLQLAQFLGRHRDIDTATTLLADYIQQQPDVYEYRFAQAQLYAADQNYDASRKVLRAVIERDGLGVRGLEARTKLAAIEFSKGDKELGEKLIAEVLAKEPANTDALIMRASTSLAANEPDDAVADLRNVLRADPTRENALLLLGKAHMMQGEPQLAIEELQKLVDSYPNNITGRKDLARLLIQAGRWEDVRELLALGVQQQPEDLVVARMYIDTLMRLDEWDAADAEAQRILDMDPGKPLGHYVRARVQQARGAYEESIDSFKLALDIEPNAVETLTGLVRSYVRKDDVAGARAFLEKFVKDNPEHVHGLTLLGEMQARVGEMDLALASNEKALTLQQGWLPAYRNLIGIHLRNEDLEAADGIVTRGLALAKDNGELLLLRANIYERGERWDEAIAIYGEQLEKNPGLDIAANNYVALVADHKAEPASLERALRYAQRFTDSRNPIFQDTLGWLYYRLGEYNEARPILERAVGRAGQLPQLRYHLGMTYYKLDQLDLARKELEAAVADAKAEYTGRDEAVATLKLL